MKPSHPEIPEQIQAEYLESNYTDKRTEPVRREYPDAEMRDMKDEYFRVNQCLDKRMNLLASIKEAFTNDGPVLDQVEELIGSSSEEAIGEDGIKRLKNRAKDLLAKVNNSYELVDQLLYGFAYQEAGRMAYYDEHGIFVYDRQLRLDERQRSIYSLPTARTGTND